MVPPARWRRPEYLEVADAKRVEQARKPRKERKRGIFVLPYERENGIYVKGCVWLEKHWTAASAAPSYSPLHLAQLR